MPIDATRKLILVFLRVALFYSIGGRSGIFQKERLESKPPDCTFNPLDGAFHFKILGEKLAHSPKVQLRRASHPRGRQLTQT